MKSKLKSFKKHVHQYRGRYAAGATLTVCTFLMVQRAKEWNDFLKEHGVYDEFYAMMEEEGVFN